MTSGNARVTALPPQFRCTKEQPSYKNESQNPASNMGVCGLRLGSNNLYFRPGTLDEAVQVLAAHGGQILSGGTDFFPALGDRPLPRSVVDVSDISEIRGIAVEPDEVSI